MDLSALNDSIPDSLNWISMLDRLSNGDITKHDSLTKINYIHCLNLLSLWKHRDRYYEQIRKAKENR